MKDAAATKENRQKHRQASLKPSADPTYRQGISERQLQSMLDAAVDFAKQKIKLEGHPSTLGFFGVAIDGRTSKQRRRNGRTDGKKGRSDATRAMFARNPFATEEQTTTLTVGYRVDRKRVKLDFSRPRKEYILAEKVVDHFVRDRTLKDYLLVVVKWNSRDWKTLSYDDADDSEDEPEELWRRTGMA